METWQTIAFNIIFYTACVQIVISLIFIFTSMSKRLLASSVSLLFIVLPNYLQLNNLLKAAPYLSLAATVGLCVFPITGVLAMQHRYNRYRRVPMAPVYAAAAASFFLLVLAPGYRVIILFGLYLFIYVYMLYLMFPARRDPQSAFLALLILMNIGYISAVLYTSDQTHIILSAGMVGVFMAFAYWYRFKSVLIGIMGRLNFVNDQNKKLNHQIARLKQSNETYRKIILEKDLELNQMARHASLAELTAGIAHELAQPLTGIKGMAQNMIDDINTEELENLQAVSDLLKICSLVDKSSSIIDHIRNFSKKRNATMKAIDLNKVILDALDLIHHQLKKNDIDLIFVLDEDIPKIHGDKISLEQLIVNLVLNSKDAILEKEFNPSVENGTIWITTFSANSSVTMIIEDNGRGMSEDIQHKIWSPFFTTKKRDHGTGVGLSICRKILKEHNAGVDIQSGDQGTQFSINFPVNNLKEAG